MAKAEGSVQPKEIALDDNQRRRIERLAVTMYEVMAKQNTTHLGEGRYRAEFKAGVLTYRDHQSETAVIFKARLTNGQWVAEAGHVSDELWKLYQINQQAQFGTQKPKSRDLER